MAEQLAGRRVAALVAKGFEQVELLEPREALKAAGAIVHVVSPEAHKVLGWNHTNWGDEIAVDRSLMRHGLMTTTRSCFPAVS
jgi:protease I